MYFFMLFSTTNHIPWKSHNIKFFAFFLIWTLCCERYLHNKLSSFGSEDYDVGKIFFQLFSPMNFIGEIQFIFSSVVAPYNWQKTMEEEKMRKNLLKCGQQLRIISFLWSANTNSSNKFNIQLSLMMRLWLLNLLNRYVFVGVKERWKYVLFTASNPQF